MKIIHIASALAIFIVGALHAEEVIHITGSTAYQAAVVTAIEDLLNNSGSYTVAYAHDQPTVNGDELHASSAILRGTISGIPVTVKCCWAGSVGGVLAVAEQMDISNIPGAAGWMLRSNIGSTTSITVGNKTLNAVGTPNYGTDLSGTYATNETLRADIAMSDSYQSSTPYTTPVLNGGQVGIVVYEAVANNGSPATFANVTDEQFSAILTGGIPLSQVTGNAADTLPVYSVGRNFDSGTRLSLLAELNIPNVQQVEATTSGLIGGGGGHITNLGLYHAETLFPTPFTRSFPAGQSGYASGAAVADILATPGSSTASDGAIALNFGAPSWLIGYLSRNDANRAVRKTSANTAHRLTFNGVKDWTGAADSLVASYADYVVTEGLYSCWEYESFLYRNGLDSNQSSIVSILQAKVAVDAGVSGIPLSSMNVSRPIEGGLITHL